MVLLHGNEDMLFGRRLHIWAQKYNRVKSQNFIRLIGSAGSEIFKPVTDLKEIIEIKYKNSAYKLYGNVGDMFNKKTNLICEPECYSDCPDFKGTDKHAHKLHGHTPSTKYNVDCGKGFVCALAYLDLDRQKRKTCIVLNEITLVNK